MNFLLKSFLSSSIAGLSIAHQAAATNLCNGSGDEVHYGHFNAVDICRNDTIECDDEYAAYKGEGRAWILPNTTVNPNKQSIKAALTDFVQNRIRSHQPQIRWGFFNSSFISPDGKKLNGFTSIGGFGFDLTYTEADLKSSRKIQAPETFAPHTLAINHCQQKGYLPSSRTIYYYFPTLIEANTGAIPFEGLMKTTATVKAVAKPKKPFSGL